jgi:hypothetical protein
VSDIPGATAATRMGHTASGKAINREPWPYAIAFPCDKGEEGLFEQPPEPPPQQLRAGQLEKLQYAAIKGQLKEAGFSRSDRDLVLRRVKSTGLIDSMLQPPKSTGKSLGKHTFEERVYRTSSVETHLTIPGVGLKCVRKHLQPIVQPKPPPVDEKYPRALPGNSLHNQPHMRTMQPGQTSLNLSDTRAARALPHATHPGPQWKWPALNTPQAQGAIDRSLKTQDIDGARPRRLVSISARDSKLWNVGTSNNLSGF